MLQFSQFITELTHESEGHRFPNTIRHKNEDWHHTGKVGHWIGAEGMHGNKKGDHSAEYRNYHPETGDATGKRVWRNSHTGKVYDE